MAKNAATKATTPWGQATLIDEVKVAQRAGEKRFASVLQLLEDDRGEPLLRLAYTNDGVVLRGPVTLRPRDVERLLSALEAHPAIAEALSLGRQPLVANTVRPAV